MPLYDQVELLCQAILSQGRQEAEKLVSQARQQAQRLVAAEEARRQEVLARTREQEKARARLEAENLEDRAALKSKRLIAEAKDRYLAAIFQQGQERLATFRQTPDYQDWLRRTLARAVAELGGGGLSLRAHPEESQFLTADLLQEVSQETGCPLELVADGDTPPGGFLALRADGLMRLDLTFQGILERQREKLRTDLAKVLWGG
jgi:vacuolar-type H+-ATPase subunit E/Vma4